MSRSLKQGVIAILFVGLLGVVAVRGSKGGLAGLWRRMTGQGGASASGALDPAEALRRYGFQLTESARDSGIKFQHEAATLDPKLDHIMPLVNAMGAAVTVLDYDGDGWLDLYVVTSHEGGRNALYHNL